MALETFAPPQEPNAGFNIDTAAAVFTASFGDGYIQRTPNGINPLRRTYRLEWNPCWKETALYITNFARAHLAVTAFWWTPPRELTPIRFICPQWASMPASFVHDQVTLTFTEEFGLGT